MRFFQPSTPQYVSQFTPLPLEFMAKQIQEKQAAGAVAEDLLTKTNDLKLKAGNHTDPLVVDEYNQWLDDNKNAIAEKYYSGDINEKDVARGLSKLQNIYQNDPAIKNIKTDYAYSLATNKSIAEGKYLKGVSSKASLRGDQPVFEYIDPKTATDADYAGAHAYILPTNIHSDQNFGSNYKEIREQVKNTLSTIKPDFVDMNGVKFFTYGNTTVSEKEITRDMVKNMARSLAENEIVDQTTPWVRYKSSVYKQEAGRPYSVNDLVEDITDNYFGYVESKDTRTDINYSPIKTDEGTTTPSPGYYNTSVTPVKNPLGNLDNLDYKKPQPGNNYIIDRNDTPENQQLLREANRLKNKGGYTSVNDLDNIQKKLLVKILVRNKEKEALDLINKKQDLPEATKAKYYKLLKQYLKAINPQEITLVNNTAIPLSTEEIKITNNELFGNTDGTTLNKLGTAIGSTLLYMDENGQEHTLEDLKQLHGEDAVIKITSKSDSKNALNVIGGSQDYTDALHVNIEGKRYFTPNKTYAPGTEEYIRQENNKVINLAYGVKLTGLDEEIPVNANSKILIEKRTDGNLDVSLVKNNGELIKSYSKPVSVDDVPNVINTIIK